MSLRDRLGSLFKGQSELELTEGGIGWPLFYLSLPIVITNLLQTAYNLADTFWLGNYSTDALAAITFAFPMVFLLISLGIGLSVAGSVLVAQNVGAGDERQAEFAASQTVTFSFVLSIVLGVFGLLFVTDLLSIFGPPEGVLAPAADYLRVISAGLPFMFGFFVFISLMRGYGDTVTPMLVMFGSVVLNIFLDPFLIFGFENNPLFGYLGLRGLEAELLAATGYAGSGIEGAAIATVFSRGLAFFVGMAIMFKGVRGVRIRLQDMVPDLGYFRKMLDIGVPASIEGTGRALSVNLMLFVIALFPTTVVAAFGIGIRVFSTIFLPAIAVGRGVETMAGQNIGADKQDRADAAAHFAAKVMFGILAGVGVLIFLVPQPIIAVFTDDPEVVRVGAEFLRYTALTFGFIGVMRSFNGAFRGAGKTLVAAAIAITMLGVIRLPLAWVGAQTVGTRGVWVAFAISNVAGALISYAWFSRGTWREADVTDSRAAPADD